MTAISNDASEIARLTRQAKQDRQQIDQLQARTVADQLLIAELRADGLIDRDKIKNLDAALVSARRIGTAIGVLMSQQNLTSDAAFALLTAASQRQNRKLRDIADEVALTGLL